MMCSTNRNIFSAVIISLLLFNISLFAQDTALQFGIDGAKDNYLKSPDGDYTSVFTIEAWVKLDSAITGNQTFVSSNHIKMMRDGDGHFAVYDGGNGVWLKSKSTIAASSSDTVDNWVHVAYSQSQKNGAGFGKLYFNGIAEDSSYAVGGYIYTIIIGNDAEPYSPPDTTNDDRWIGCLDELRFWKVERSQTEILANMGHELSGSENDLEFYYQFNEGSGGMARNLIGGNNLSLYNMGDDTWVDGVFYSKGRPVANAGEDMIVPADSANSIILDGSASKDKDGTIENYSWTENGMEIANGAIDTVSLDQGEHEIVLTVTDNDGKTDSDNVSVFVMSAASNRSIELNNGTLDELLLATDFDITQKSWTLECWVKFRTFDDDVVQELHLLETAEDGPGSSTQWYVQTEDPDTHVKRHVLSSNGSGYAFGGTGKKEFVTDKWYHIALSVDGVSHTYAWYINDELDRDSTSITANGHPNMMPNVIIGHFRDFNQDNFWSAAMAKFDEVCVWYKARTQEEIKSDMREIDINADGLEAYWTFDRTDFREDVTGHGHTLQTNDRVDVTNLSDDVPDVNNAVSEESKIMPEDFSLQQNYPNPFNPSTTISYTLPSREYVTMDVYNVLGEKVAELVNGTLPAGLHKVVFEAGNLPSGMYFYKISAGNFVAVKKMLILK